MHFKYFIHIPVFKLDRLIHFYPTTRFCPFFVDWSIYVFRISISTQKGIFGLNILLYTFTMLSYQSSEQLLISLCQRNIFFTIFLTFTSYEKKETPVQKWLASVINKSFVRPTSSKFSPILDHSSLAVLYIVYVV